MPRYDFSAYRLFVASPLAEGSAVPLEPGQTNYLLNVLRMEAGATLLAFNGRDGEWRVELVKPARKTAVLKALMRVRPQSAPGSIRFAFAPLKAARLDYVIEKAVELGAARISPVTTERTQGARLRPDRLRAHAIEAAEQCGILNLPAIEPEAPLPAFLAGLAAEELLVFCDEDAAVADPLDALKKAHRAVATTLLIGPEGGFTDAERAVIARHSAVCRLSLGPRILRADTAGVAALALVQATLGDWRG